MFYNMLATKASAEKHSIKLMHGLSDDGFLRSAASAGRVDLLETSKVVFGCNNKVVG